MRSGLDGILGEKEATRVCPNEIRLVDETLYHGSPRAGLTEFIPSKIGPYGRGVYLTLSKEIAEGYANDADGKHGGKIEPTLYTVPISNLRLFNAEAAEGDILAGFGRRLSEIAKRTGNKVYMTLAECLATTRFFGPLQRALYDDESICRELQSYLTRLGYDGIGHAIAGIDANGRPHQDFVCTVFCPEKIRTAGSEKVEAKDAPETL